MNIEEKEDCYIVMSNKDKEELARFKEVAKRFIAKHGRNKKTAKKYLVGAGVYNTETIDLCL